MKISSDTFVWFFAVPAFILLALIWTGEMDLYRLTTKLVNAALVLTIGNLFFKLWLSPKNDVDEKIFQNSIATAYFSGAVYIALAIIFTFG